MNRVLIRFLTMMLLPVLIFSTGETARAATGAVSVFTFEPGTNSHDFGSSRDCSLSAYFERVGAADPTIEIRDFSCSTGFNVSSLNIGFTASGTSCSFAGYVGQMDGTGIQTASMGAAAGYSDADCNVTSLCWDAQVDYHSNPWTDDDQSACQPIGLGVPPEVSSGLEGCPDGVPAGAMTANFTTASWPGAPYRDLNWSVTLDAQPVMIPFRVVIWYTSNGVLEHHVTDIQYAGPGNGLVKSGKVGPSWDGGQTLVVKGVQLVIFGAAMNGSDEWGNVGNNGAWDYNVPIITGPPDTYMGGANWPERCSFYFGTKIGNTANDGHDEPGGEMTGPAPGGGGPSEPPVTNTPAPAPAEASGCGDFSWSDPASWASAGICMLVKLAYRIVDLLGSVLGVLAGLVGQVGALLETLFVPSASSWGFDGLYDQFEARPPGSVLVSIGDGMSGFIGGYSAGGCGVLADFSSEDMDAQLTCSNVQSIPGYGALYALVQVGMFALTGLAVFRMLAGKVGGDDG